MLPAWVVNGPKLTAGNHHASPHPPVRFHFRERGAPTPTGVDQHGKFRERIKDKYPVKCRGRLGPGHNDDKEI